MDKKIEQLLDTFEALIDIKITMALVDVMATTNIKTMVSTKVSDYNTDVDMWRPMYYERRERLRISLMKVLEGVLEKASK
jgi:hypothetical protein